MSGLRSTGDYCILGLYCIRFPRTGSPQTAHRNRTQYHWHHTRHSICHRHQGNCLHSFPNCNSSHCRHKQDYPWRNTTHNPPDQGRYLHIGS
jgi:hypothetical protein